MKKFNEKDNQLLINEAEKAVSEGKSLSAVFKSFAEKTGRAKGSVRNRYYTIMKENNAFVSNEQKRNSVLKVEKILSFSTAEEEKLVTSIVSLVAEGKSVRGAICILSKGDGKLALRMQNKYRNLAKKRPDLIEKEFRKAEREKGRVLHINKRIGDCDMAKVTDAINRLIEGIKDKYRLENIMLKEENAMLRERIENIDVSNKTKTFFNLEAKKLSK